MKQALKVSNLFEKLVIGSKIGYCFNQNNHFVEAFCLTILLDKCQRKSFEEINSD